MVVLIIAGLVVVLVVLVAVRSALRDKSQQVVSRPPLDPPAATTSTPGRTQRLDDSVASLGHSNASYDYYLWESQRIASRGESRAATLDFFGYLVSSVAALVVIGTFLAVVNAEQELTSAHRVTIVLGACGTVLALAALAAIFFGFGALVRNTSRSLSITAGVALDSFEPTD